MIPPFDHAGFLPPGVHPAERAEIKSRFGLQSEIRRVQMESVGWMRDLAARAGVQRVALNGSFVTDIIEPNDVDCVLLLGAQRPEHRLALRELRKGLPFLDVALVRDRAFDEYVSRVFAVDRAGATKGMVEVIRWT